MAMKLVYKICDQGLWDEACKSGIFAGAGIDLADGYIHFSTADQVAETAYLHFRKVEGLVLVAVPEDAVDLVWEESRGGTLFPHLYDSLPTGQVAWAEPLALDEQGMHLFPDTIPPFSPPQANQ